MCSIFASDTESMHVSGLSSEFLHILLFLTSVAKALGL